MDESQPARWNRFVRDEFGSPLQTWDWGVFQESLGKKILRIDETDFKALLVWQTLPLGVGYWYAPRGPVIRKGADAVRAIEKFRTVSAERIAREPEKALCVRFEPDFLNVPIAEEALLNLKLKRANSVQPHETRIINLRRSESELMHEMEHDTRYAIRAAERRGVSVRLISDKHDKQTFFDVFWDIFEETAVRHGLKNYPKDYYRELFGFNGDLRTVVAASYLGKTSINASVIVFFGEEAIYLYSASRTGYGRYNAPSLALWRSIQFAKANGCAVFDLWGVSRKKAGWKGITSFKEGFGGEQIQEPGAWDFPLQPLKYRIYRSLTKLPH